MMDTLGQFRQDVLGASESRIGFPARDFTETTRPRQHSTSVVGVQTELIEQMMRSDRIRLSAQSIFNSMQKNSILTLYVERHSPYQERPKMGLELIKVTKSQGSQSAVKFSREILWSQSTASKKTGSLSARITGPVRFMTKLLDTWNLDKNDAVPLLGFEQLDQTHVADILDGLATLNRRDTKDRIAYLIQIRKTLSGLFRDKSVENEWLRERHKLLDNETPMGLMLEGSMRNLLLVLEYVNTVAGI